MGSESQALSSKYSFLLSYLCPTETSSLTLQASRISQRVLSQFTEEQQTHHSTSEGKCLQNICVLGLILTHPANRIEKKMTVTTKRITVTPPCQRLVQYRT